VSDDVKQVQVRKARQFYSMLGGAGCRPAAVRRYFGETDVEPCGVCDLCLDPPEAVDATVAAQKALAAVHRMGGRFGRVRIVDHLLGKTKDPQPSETALSTYGVGKEFSPTGWRELIDQLLFEGLLREDPNDGRPLIGLGDAAAVKAVYRGEQRVMLARQPEAHDDSTRSGRPRKRTREASAAIGDAQRPLFEALRTWRREQAAEQAVPPYVIFNDRTLMDIALLRPTSLGDLSLANGVGQAKLDRYGAAVLKVVREN
jgi:ATP-dependent DNA helicase RecQ